MRKALVVLVVLAALVFSATPASALVTDINALPASQLQAKYSDFSDLYTPGAAGTSGTPALFGQTITSLTAGIGTLENRAIFNTSSIQQLNTTPVWFPISQQATGLFYNLTLIGVTPDLVTGNITLDFGPSIRNPLTSGPGLASAPAGSGGVIEIYRNTAMDFNADPNSVGALCPTLPRTIANVNGNPPVSDGTWGPASWVQGSGGASRDTYPGASSGTLWLSGEFVPYTDPGISILGHTAGTVFSETINLTTGIGSGTGFVHLVDGSFFPLVQKGNLGFGPDVDLTLISDLSGPRTPDGINLFQVNNYTGVGYWPVNSQDPVTFNVIPEPATMTLLGLGLLGIRVIRRRMGRA